ncbi:MAG: RloB domain-containing protein [Bacteroidetes bacterium]|nr:RloB domain-containing protein [Bacteroidota bacterium]
MCAFDADVAQRNLNKANLLKGFIKKYKNNKNVIICDSLPSIEFWFLLHFKKTNKTFSDYKAIRNELGKYISNYDKTDVFLETDEWVKFLILNQDTAAIHAKQLPSEGSYSNIYRAIELLDNLLIFLQLATNDSVNLTQTEFFPPKTILQTS